VATCSTIILVPLYVSAGPNDGYQDPNKIKKSVLEKMTLSNAYKDEYRVWIVFTLTVIYSISAHYLVY
jgi:hypothetical protein